MKSSVRRPTDDHPGYALVEAALMEGEHAAAIAQLDAIAAESEGMDQDGASSALRLAAELARITGQPGRAASRARTAVHLAHTPPTRLAALIELGEATLALGRPLAAADAFRRALGTDLDPASRCALLRRHGLALAAAGLEREAADAFAHAHRVAAGDGDDVGASHVLVEAVAAVSGRSPKLAERLDHAARRAAEKAGNVAALADLDLLAAARSLERGQLDEALRRAEAARHHALDAVVPLAYVASALAVARISDRLGNRVEAYRSIVKGYATLSDLLGAALSSATFEPELRRFRARWGDEAFAQAKDRYDAARRQELGLQPGSPRPGTGQPPPDTLP